MPNRFLLCLCSALCLPATAHAAPDLFLVLSSADSLAAAGYADSAVVLGRSAVSAYPPAGSASDTAQGWAEHRLGNYHFASGLLDSARTHWQRAADLYAMWGASQFKRIGVQNNFAVLESMSGRTVQAAFAFEEALRLHREAHTDTTVDGANVMNNLALMYDELDRGDEALALFEESGRIWRAHLGETDWKVGLNIGNRGLVYARRGQDGLAEYRFRESMRMIRASLGPDHVRLAEPEGNLAAILVARGRLEEAEVLYKDALRVLALGVGEDHPDLIARLNGLGTLYRERGDAAAAEDVYRRALAIAQANGGDTSLATADQFHHLALAVKEQGRTSEADSLWDLAERAYVSQDRSVSHAMLTLLQARMRSADKPRRASYRNRVIALTDSLYRGRSHPARASALLDLSDVAFEGLLWAEAAALSDTALSIGLDILATNSLYLNERDALAAGAQMRRAVDSYLRAVLESAGPTEPVRVPPDAAGRLSASKGLIFDLLASRARARDNRTDNEAGRLRAEYDAVRVALAGQYARADSWSVSGDRGTADSLQHLADSLEARLAQSTGNRSSRLATDLRVKDLLSGHPGTCVVQYFRLEPSAEDPDLTGRYLALISDPAGTSSVLDLGSVYKLDSLVSAYRRHLLELAGKPGVPGPEALTEYTHVAAPLMARIWNPIAVALFGSRAKPDSSVGRLCLIVPDGQVGLVSLGTLPDGRGRYLADLLHFRYLSSLRELSRFRTPAAKAQGLLALGDPAFDSTAATDPDVPTPGLLMRSSGVDCSFTIGESMARLPLSRWEAEQVGADWNRGHQDSATVLVGELASEATFRTASRGKKALHLATHGYYLDPSCEERRPDLQNRVHPLLLSGLLLAGSNSQKPSAPANQDGVLSAYEVSALDLSGTETVVLSACESGIGAAVASEGLYGLRRAFKLAGARSVVCSLWPVPDRYTAAFMSKLYDASAESVASRLDRLQQDERLRLRREGLADHPLAWGAFIAFGSVD